MLKLHFGYGTFTTKKRSDLVAPIYACVNFESCSHGLFS